MGINYNNGSGAGLSARSGLGELLACGAMVWLGVWMCERERVQGRLGWDGAVAQVGKGPRRAGRPG
jgi:hypothetical protein